MANPIGNPVPFTTKPSSSNGQHGRSKTSGLKGTRQKFDDGSTVSDATEELSAVRDNELDDSRTATWRHHEHGNVIDVKQTSYSYKNRVLPDATLFTNLNDIPADVPAGFTATASKSVIASQFGKNDQQDEGTGSSTMGIVQTNSEVFGASVKISVMKAVFGENWKTNTKRLGALADVYFPDKKRMVRVPLVDVGPGESIPAEVDLTWAADQFLGTQGQAKVRYRLLLPA